ncbi:MAG: MBL fold metallo-hydrolase [Alphaproteobacteria bacterium]
MSIKVKFWGVRGSVATPGNDYVEFGGNTSCVEVTCGDRRLIFDAGTGIRQVGEQYFAQDIKSASIYLSHSHWDHINGFPFFDPGFAEGFAFDIWAGHLLPRHTIQDILAGQMTQPFFPVPIEIMKSNMTFHDFKAGETLDAGTDSDGEMITLKTIPLNHPNGATGYRVEYKGGVACYITDVEHIVGETDQVLVDFVHDADLMIYDSTYDDEDFADKISWGHSTWQEGIRIAKAANVKQLAVFHHDPKNNDEFMHGVEKKAKAVFDGAFVAREFMEVSV